MRDSEEDPQQCATLLPGRRKLLIPALLLISITAFSLIYAFSQRSQRRELAAIRDEMKSALARSSAQYNQLAARLDALATERRAEQVAVPVFRQDVQLPRATVAHVQPSRRAAAPDPHYKKLEAQLTEQQKQIARAKDDIRDTREQLQTNLNSTRDELSGSIARNHDELVELQKRGERTYYEFDLPKSKEFRRTGPLSLSLRKTDTKHNRFDLVMVVEDVQVEKKNVNVYEPVLVYLPDRPQPLELVINQLAKNNAKGYISEPRYKKSELAVAGSTPARDREPGLNRR